MESERILHYIVESDSCEEQDSELQNVFKPFLPSILSLYITVTNPVSWISLIKLTQRR